MMRPERFRALLVWWMYGVVAGHLLTGMLLPWVANLAVFDSYHHDIGVAFWGQNVPGAARAQQVWWISLFGPTVQSLALWMGALVSIGDRQRSAWAWGWLIAGIVLWAPQDMLISLRANAWVHVWIDSFALVTMLPPLVWLWCHDRRAARLPV